MRKSAVYMHHERHGQPHRHQPAARRGTTVISGAVRQRKDPKSFKDMDEARAFLHKDAAKWSLSSLLNWLSEASGSFGKPDATVRACGACMP